MSLPLGTRIGPYEIVAPIGAGGMGEVYRARDTRLNRDVALKILPDAFANDTDRLARFTREAQTLAALNDPHIAHIHGLEESGAVHALAMEFVDGEDLAEHLKRGPIPPDEALAIARQIIDGLEAAHDQGIVHRDLKPANLKVTAEGVVKILDFGLAKAIAATAASPSAAALSYSPTITSPLAMTAAGMILGTAAYMSPEQARGKTVDRRTDIWAFGCVLFEMLTGRTPFPGEDVVEVIGALVHKEPEWTTLPAATPPLVRVALQRCLEKDPKKRIRDVADVRLLLDGAFDSPRLETGNAVTVPATARGTWSVAGIAAAAALLVGAIAGAATWASTRPKPTRAQTARFAITLPAAQTIRVSNTDRNLVVSPDGTHLVYVTAGVNGGQLILRAIDRLDAEPLRGIDDARVPFWSPDSKWIGYFSNRNEIRKVSVSGGPSIAICQSSGAPRGASWGPDDTIVFATNDTTTGLMSVRAGGGEPQALTKPDTGRGEQDHLFPSVLPGGRAVLFTITGRSADLSQIAVLDLKTGARKVLVRGGNQAEYVEGGYLVYGIGGALRAVRFDASRNEVLGDPVPITEQVTMAGTGAGEYSVSRSGVLAYKPGNAPGGVGALRSLVWVDRSGRAESIKAPPRAYTYPRLSPDGTRLAVAIADQDTDVWIWDFAHETLSRLTFDPAADVQPTWTPDGRRIVFSSTRSGASNMFAQSADGTGTVERLTTSPNGEFGPSISPDGKSIVMMEQTNTGNDLMLFRVGGKPQPEPLLATTFSESRPEISPDGRWLAYNSNDSGRDEVYVRPFPDVQSGRWQISASGGTRPAWARSGKELFYGASDGAVMAVPVQTGATFSSGNPKKLFDWPTLGVPTLGRTFDVSGDGQRFLMIREPGAGDSASGALGATLVVVLNWTEELKQLLPAD